MNFPPWRRAYSQLKRAVRTPPMVSLPVGLGAKRVTTFGMEGPRFGGSDPVDGTAQGGQRKASPAYPTTCSKSRLTSPEVAYLIRRAEVAPRRRAAKRTTVAGITPHIEIRLVRTVA